MLISATLSKPCKNVEQILGKKYIKVKLILSQKETGAYRIDFFTEKQAFRKFFTQSETEQFLAEHMGKTFRNVVKRTETEEITILTNRHGEIKELKKPLLHTAPQATLENNRCKNYILKEGEPIPFLVRLGVTNKDGTVLSKRYDKFRQINRFVEFIKDIIPTVIKLREEEKRPLSKEEPLKIIDFGCGKSYLTFAVHYYLSCIETIPCKIIGLDLKEDVIKTCNALAQELNAENLKFIRGNIETFNIEENRPDIIITLHACDTATDYALFNAIKAGTKAILSVPCCQHEINKELDNITFSEDSPFASITRYGLIKERFSALATDAIRAELLEESGYNVQIIEFIDMEHTPKNLLIRAVKTLPHQTSKAVCAKRKDSLLNALGAEQTLNALLKTSLKSLY